MKRVLLIMLAIVAISPVMMADNKSKKTTAKKTETAKAEANDSEIHWITIEDLQVKMREHPRKVYIDIYTDWCGWCKRMEATTFHNKDVVHYMNEKYYCVRFNAERQDTIHFMGKTYYYEPQNRANTLAVELMQGKMSYPTSILALENFQSPQPVPGYQDVKTMEMIVKFLGDDLYKTQHFDEYSKTFTPSWL